MSKILTPAEFLKEKGWTSSDFQDDGVISFCAEMMQHYVDYLQESKKNATKVKSTSTLTKINLDETNHLRQ